MVHVVIRQPPDRIGQRGRKQRRLAREGVRRAEDRLDIVDEAHLEHLVRFVEHHVLHATEIERALIDQIQGATRRPHDDMHAVFQPPLLARIGLPTVDRQDAHTQGCPIAVNGFRRLDGQLARGREDQRLQSLTLQVLEHGQSERCRLACTGLGLPHDIVSGEQRWNRFRLNRCRGGVTECGYGLEDFGDQAQVFKRQRHGYVVAPATKNTLPRIRTG